MSVDFLKILGTLSTRFRIAINGPMFISDASRIHVKDVEELNYRPISVGDAFNAEDAVSLGQLESIVDVAISDISDGTTAIGKLAAGATMVDAVAGVAAANSTIKSTLEAIFSAITVTGTVAESTTSRTLVIGDAFKIVESTNAAATTITVPPNSAVAFVIGTIIHIYSAGAAGVTIAPGAGVTIRNNGAPLAQYVEVLLRKRGFDEWVRVG